MKKHNPYVHKIKSKNGLMRFLKSVKRHSYWIEKELKSNKFLRKQKNWDSNVRKAIENRDLKIPFNLKFLYNHPKAFSDKKYSFHYKEILYIPGTFSFIDGFKETFIFLRKLILLLNSQSTKHLILDYKNCTRIDVDASICMDSILGDFFFLQNQYTKKGWSYGPETIIPTNYKINQDVEKVLFSIGAFSYSEAIRTVFDNVIPLKVLINSRENANRWELSETHQTKIVEYIKKCLEKLNYSLTIEAETEFYKVIGEVMSNAEEHSSMPHRFAVGYFQESDDHDYGLFNFTIFNFGETIYDKFKSKECQNKKIVEQMQNLSSSFTQKGFFTKALFEEETLWTLYALQEGVTSTKTKRGNGSIQYIENFFKLKGNMDNDKVSKLVLMSGHSRIVFDGTYKISLKPKSNSSGFYKTITFNDSGDFSTPPDKNFVNFADYYFPGTVISARILINNCNTVKINEK